MTEIGAGIADNDPDDLISAMSKNPLNTAARATAVRLDYMHVNLQTLPDTDAC